MNFVWEFLFTFSVLDWQEIKWNTFVNLTEQTAGDIIQLIFFGYMGFFVNVTSVIKNYFVLWSSSQMTKSDKIERVEKGPSLKQRKFLKSKVFT